MFIGLGNIVAMMQWQTSSSAAMVRITFLVSMTLHGMVISYHVVGSSSPKWCSVSICHQEQEQELTDNVWIISSATSTRGPGLKTIFLCHQSVEFLNLDIDTVMNIRIRCLPYCIVYTKLPTIKSIKFSNNFNMETTHCKYSNESTSIRPSVHWC